MPNFQNQQPEEEYKDFQERRNGWGSLNLKLEYMQRDIDEIKRTVKDDKTGYVSREEFLPVKNIAYGLITITLTALIGGAIALLLRGGK